VVEPLTQESLRGILGPIQPATLGHVDVLAEVQCDGYVRRAVGYDVPSGRASAFVCIPDGAAQRVPVIFCHHQQAGQFDLGKSEVVGLRGDPGLAYAAELAQRGYLTISPDAIGFEDRNWADGANLGWFELSSRLVVGRTMLADLLQEVSLAIDYATSLPAADDASPIATRSRATQAFRRTSSFPASPARTTSRTCWPQPPPVGICSSPAAATCGAEAPPTSPTSSPRAGTITSPCASDQAGTSSPPATESWPTSSSEARSAERAGLSGLG
jgi:hypothetical protein